MTQKYQNTAFESGKSQFVDTTNQTELTFTAKNVEVSTRSGAVPMTKGVVVARKQVTASVPCNDCQARVTESVKIEFSTVTGDVASLLALRAEAIRVMDAALATYGLSAGLVPPSYATFEV